MSDMTFNDGFFIELGHKPAVTALCVGKGEEVAAAARASAPVDTGKYRDGISVEVVDRGRRNVALVKSSDPKTMVIESKTGNLARALNQVKRGG